MPDGPPRALRADHGQPFRYPVGERLEIGIYQQPSEFTVQNWPSFLFMIAIRSTTGRVFNERQPNTSRVPHYCAEHHR